MREYSRTFKITSDSGLSLYFSVRGRLAPANNCCAIAPVYLPFLST